MLVEYRILGPLEVVDEGEPVALGRLKERLVLAILLLHANEFVARERLIDELWGESPPPTAKKAVNVYVSQLRKALVRNGRDRVNTVSGQRLSQLGDVDVDRLSGRRRGRLAPELVDQALARDELVRMQEQDRQDEPLLQPAQRDRLALVDHLERPEDPVLHRWVLPLPKPKRKQPAPRVLIRLWPASYRLRRQSRHPLQEEG